MARRRAAPAAVSDPLADPAVAATPEPVLRQRATESVRADTNRLLKEIMADTDRAASGIELATGTHARRLEPFAGAARERFGRAAEATAGVSQTLADRLAGKGAEAGAGLREKLAAINAPDRLSQEVAGGTETFGRDAANAGFGIDSATLDEIISRGAGAEDFAASLPGIANIAGVRSIGDVRAAGQRAVQSERGKVPALIAELMEGARDREVDKANIRASREIGLQKTAAEKAANKADAAAAAAAAVAQGKKPDSSLSNALGYLVTENAVAILDAAGNRIPTQGALDDLKGRKDDRATAVKNKSAAVAKARSTAFTRARELAKGRPPAPGETQPGNEFQIPGASVRRPVPTSEAVAAIYAEIAPQLIARFAMKADEIRAIAVEAVKAAGFAIAAPPTPRGGR